MIELNPITVVLLVEALIVLLLLMLIFLLINRNKNSANQTAVRKLINKLEKDEKYKTNDLEKIFIETCGIGSDISEEFINEIGIKERKLYTQIVKIFFKKDIKLLTKIDQHINNLSESYINLASNAVLNNQKDGIELEFAKGKINDLRQENDVLQEKLTAATSTMKEVSEEYMRVFRGTQTELELRKSSIKMFKTFRETEKQIKKSVKTTEIEEL